MKQPLQHHLLITVCLLVAGCEGAIPASPTGPPPTPIPPHAATITQSQSECAVDVASEPIPAGKVEFTAVNETDSLVAFHIWRIVEGSTYDKLMTRIGEENDRVEANQESLGPPTFLSNLIELQVEPHDSQSRVGGVISGTYAVVCIRDYNDQLGKRPYSVVGPFEVK